MTENYPWFTGQAHQFKNFEFELEGEKMVLIIPNETKAVGFPWFEDDKMYRSCIFRVSDGAIVSPGYKKFVNFGENPVFEPVDINEPFVAMEKIDGTCLICSKYKDSYIIRTRGMIGYEKMSNAHEIEPLLKKYHVREMLDEYEGAITLIFEWISPENVLCVRYNEADIILTGIIKHENYSLWKQSEVDAFASSHALRRPRHFEFKGDLNNVSGEIKEWIGTEGCVCYFQNDQVLKKMKSNWHHSLHVARSIIGKPEKLIDYLYDLGCFEAQADVQEKISHSLEFEVFQYYSDVINKAIEAHNRFVRNCMIATALVNDCKDPYEVIQLRDSDRWNESETYLWTAFRNKTHRKSFVVQEISKYLNELLDTERLDALNADDRCC